MPLTIAGIGASAGGLEAFSQVLRALPGPPDMALVFVTHLAPQHESALPTLLANVTSLPVVQAADGMALEANHVYIMPPNCQMSLEDVRLRVLPRPTDRSQMSPIDFFFSSLAREASGRAVGVILSGTASDGAEGMREIKAAGGITMAQAPETAKYDGMPRAAIATGMVDLVRPLPALADELVRIGSHPYFRTIQPRRPGDDQSADDAQLARIFNLLRARGGIDFSQYKCPTIQRRLQRRMALHKIDSVEHYVKHLTENPAEAGQLQQDILIHVTRFFREPESFQALAKVAFPQIVASRQPAHPLRIWVPGCSTGEEPYSLAISLLEFLEDSAQSTPIQFFATDVSDGAIDQARAGVYPATIAEDVSPERLRRFFSKTDGAYRINKAVRDLCVFARQDLIRDPPFSKLDLIVCRNVLIYLAQPQQQKLMAVFHYALRPSGFLVLGAAETTGAQADLFSLCDKKHRVYQKKLVEAPGAMPLMVDGRPRFEPGLRLTQKSAAGDSIQAEASRLILDRYAPPGVIVDENWQIIHFRGQTGPFLEPAPGEASLNLLKMAREGLLYGLRSALHAARKSEERVRKERLKVHYDGHQRDVNLDVMPVTVSGESRHFLVLFEDVTPVLRKTPEPRRAKKRGKSRPEVEAQVQRLRQELEASRGYLQSIIQDLEAANEELQSANEEILSSNEELQSTNEELDTAKEELQSTNEEMNTVNDELHARNEELSRVNSDLVNLLGSVQIAIVIVAGDLRIRRFTPMAERVLNLIPADVGRPIGNIKPNINCPDLERLTREVIDRIAIEQREVQDALGRWYSLTIRPYKNVENRIDGAVLSLFDIHDVRQHEAEAQQAREMAEAAVALVNQPLVVLDSELRVVNINPAFRETFRIPPLDGQGSTIFEIAHGQWNVPQLREALERIVAGGQPEERHVIEHEFPGLGRRTLVLSGRRIRGSRDQAALLMLAVQEPSASTR